MAMFDQVRLRTMLERDEELRLFPYDDDTGGNLGVGITLQGNVTIGIGRNLQGKPLSQAVINLMYSEDVGEAVTTLNNISYSWQALSEGRKLVLLSMAFNMGNKIGNFKKMWHALENGNYNAAADEMIDSLWYKQTGDRAKRLVKMMREG